MNTDRKSKINALPDEFIDEVLDPEFIAELMEEHGCDIRAGLFHPAMTVWLMMLQRLSDKGSLSEAVEAFQNGAGGVLTKRCSSSPRDASQLTGGYSQARTRIPEGAVNTIADTINDAIVGSHPEHLWHGRHAFLLDGTDFRVLAEGDLKKEYPPSQDGKRKSPWSTIRSVIATHAVTGVALRAANGPMYGKHAQGEVGLAREVIPTLPQNSIVVADKGLGTFIVAHSAIDEGHDTVLRLTEVRAKQALNGKLSSKDGDYPCQWTPAKTTRNTYGIPQETTLEGRIIKHTVQQPGFKPEVLYLFTTLTLPVDNVVALYALRWKVETDFRTLKTALKMELLDVRSASMARKEIALGICAYNLVLNLIAYAAHEANLAPRDISFTRYATKVFYVGLRASLLPKDDEKQRQELREQLLDRVHQLAHPKRSKPRSSRPRRIHRHPRPFPFTTTKSRRA